MRRLVWPELSVDPSLGSGWTSGSRLMTLSGWVETDAGSAVVLAGFAVLMAGADVTGYCPISLKN